MTHLDTVRNIKTKITRIDFQHFTTEIFKNIQIPSTTLKKIRSVTNVIDRIFLLK